MSDIENSGGDDDSVTISKKNGTSALKENNVAKKVLANDKMDVDADDHNHSDSAGNKLNGSSKVSGKEHHVMNGGSSVDEDDDDVDDDEVTNGKSTDDGETSHLVTDDDSIQEATPTPSSLNSPRKASHARNDEYG